MNLAVPEALGGLGLDYRTYASILHELSYASPSVAVTVAVHNMVGKILGNLAPAAIRESVVTQWGTPGCFGAFALSEAEAGSDAGAVQTLAVDDGDAYRVTGEKMWITNGMNARWFLTLVRVKDAPADGQLLALLIDGEIPGLHRSKIHGKMGLRGSETAVIGLDGVRVPKTHVIGRVGEGLKVFLSTLNEGRIGIAAQACGIAEACVDEMSRYARQRRQFNRPIGRLQAVANMVADSAMELAAAKALIWRAAAVVDEGDTNRSAASMAKLYASEAANRIAYRAVQVHGGSGVVHECRVEQLYRDVRVTTIYEGTSEIQRLLIAREMVRNSD
jgi:alkylation response protein AidB-like acyl-CoA dehydrogenase